MARLLIFLLALLAGAGASCCSDPHAEPIVLKLESLQTAAWQVVDHASVLDDQVHIHFRDVEGEFALIQSEPAPGVEPLRVKDVPVVRLYGEVGYLVGSIVGDRELLTSAHYLKKLAASSVFDVWIEVQPAHEEYKATCAIPRDYGSGNLDESSRDWALCVLEKPWTKVAPLSIYTSRPPTAKSLRLFGYGPTDCSDPAGSGTSLNGYPVTAESYDETKSAFLTTSGARSCRGDSGGGVLAETSTGGTVLVGSVSGQQTCNPPPRGYFACVSLTGDQRFRQFISKEWCPLQKHIAGRVAKGEFEPWSSSIEFTPAVAGWPPPCP